MTAVVEEAEIAPSAAAGSEVSPIRPAPWHARAGALVVDVLPGVAVVATMALVFATVPPGSVWSWVGASVAGLVILLMLVNRLLLPVVTGWNLGRGIFGIAVVRPDGTAVGPWGLLLRDLAHVLDTASVLVGWLWPLWDSRRRTFADLLLRTEVRSIQQPPQPRRVRRLAVAIVLAAAVLCVGGAAMSYVVAYRHDRAIDRTRAQLETQGPKMVAQMLTYDPQTLRDDFAHAQSLTTDQYRRQLAQQQEAVQKGHPVHNEYWVTDSSIQSPTPNRATMLLLLQGQRGLPPDERYISATVRVNFVKAADAHWLIDDLTVLTKPKPGVGGK